MNSILVAMKRVTGPLLATLLFSAASSALAQPGDVAVDGGANATSGDAGFDLAVSAEAAVGQTSEFENQLLGARLSYRFEPRFRFGGYLGAVRLKGKEGAVHNVLPYASVEYRILLDGGWAVPFRFGSGYLPKNGPFARLGPALAISLGGSTELIVDAFVPAYWLTQNRPELSLDFGAEIAIKL